jgi:hypothetical protein
MEKLFPRRIIPKNDQPPLEQLPTRILIMHKHNQNRSKPDNKLASFVSTLDTELKGKHTPQ